MKKLLNAIFVICLIVLVIYCVKRDEEKVVNHEVKKIVVNVNDRDLIVELENNTSAEAFYKRLKKDIITINAHDYGNFEKVGNLGFDLPRNDKYFETKAGDLILYQGNQITLYYDTNKYTFTKLGHVINVDSIELKEILGSGDVTLRFIIKR